MPEIADRAARERSFARARMTKLTTKVENPQWWALVPQRGLSAERWLLELASALELQKQTPELTEQLKLGRRPAWLQLENPRTRLRALVPSSRPVGQLEQESPEQLLPMLARAQKKAKQPLAKTKNNAHLPRSQRARAALGTAVRLKQQASPGGGKSL